MKLHTQHISYIILYAIASHSRYLHSLYSSLFKCLGNIHHRILLFLAWHNKTNEMCGKIMTAPGFDSYPFVAAIKLLYTAAFTGKWSIRRMKYNARQILKKESIKLHQWNIFGINVSWKTIYWEEKIIITAMASGGCEEWDKIFIRKCQ